LQFPREKEEMVGKKTSIRASPAPVYPALYLHMWKSKNEEFVLQQLFKELLKNPKCYSSFSQMKSYCTLFTNEKLLYTFHSSETLQLN
jgi:hypothetical protein